MSEDNVDISSALEWFETRSEKNKNRFFDKLYRFIGIDISFIPILFAIMNKYYESNFCNVLIVSIMISVSFALKIILATKGLIDIDINISILEEKMLNKDFNDTRYTCIRDRNEFYGNNMFRLLNYCIILSGINVITLIAYQIIIEYFWIIYILIIICIITYCFIIQKFVIQQKKKNNITRKIKTSN
jgi:hypothetical protein